MTRHSMIERLNSCRIVPAALWAIAIGWVSISAHAQPSLTAPVSADPVSPNIVLIVLDDLGYSDLGAYGGEIQTPNIDALADAGARFSRFYVAASCGPTRAMLLTGVDHHLAGVGSMPELMPLAHRGKPGYLGVLNDRVQTISARLQDAGYFTAVAGKWHLGVGPRNQPPARGFDDSFIQADNGSDNFDMRPYLPMQASARWYENGERVASLPDNFYSSTYFVDRMIQTLVQPIERRQPFFAYLAFQANHLPIQAPAHFIDQYRGRYLEGWDATRRARLNALVDLGLLAPGATVAPALAGLDWQALSAQEQYFEARRMQAYAGMATAMDYEVGRLLAFLRDRSSFENTVFIVLSDNGAAASEPYENASARRWLEANFHRDVETLGTYGSWVSAGRGWGRVSNTPFSGLKFSSSEGGVRAPLIITGVSGAHAGAVHAARAHVTDIFPTIMALANLETTQAGSELLPTAGKRLLPPAGKSLVELLRGLASEVHAPAQATGYEFSGNSALFRDDYKLTYNRPPAGDGQWRLFNVVADPGETQDLKSSLPAQFRAMREAYDDYETAVGVLPMPENYSLNRQVVINGILFSYLPEYRGLLLGSLGAVIVVVLGVVALRRRSRVAGPAS